MQSSKCRSEDVSSYPTLLPPLPRCLLGAVVLYLICISPVSLGKPLGQTGSTIPGTRHTTPSATSAFLDSVACLSRGKWVRNPTPRPIPWLRLPWNNPLQNCDHAWFYTKKMLAGPAADTAAITGANWTVREGLKWEWEPEDRSCPLEPFDREGFCRVLGPNRSILIVGDSINWGFYMALRNAMLMNATYFPETIMVPTDHPEWYFPGGSPETAHGSRFCSEEFGTAHAVTIRYLRNSWLSLTTIPEKSALPWVDLLSEYAPDIVIVNRGAQYTPMKAWEGGVREALKVLREKVPEALIIYRNTPAGHLNCTSIHTPLTHRQDPSLLPFNWDKFGPQNDRAKEFLHEYGALYMDVDTMMALRADGHLGLSAAGNKDCLHYCNPGPMDTWVTLLFNILKKALPLLNPNPTPNPDLPPRKRRTRGGGGGGGGGGEGGGGWEGIRGTGIKSAQGAEKVREELACISSEMEWAMAPPRVLPWPKAPVGAIGFCDKLHKDKGGAGAVYGEDADAIARSKGRGREEWGVRKAAVFEWRMKKGARATCRWEEFDAQRMCSLLGPGASVLVVGDSLSLQFTRAVLHAAMMDGHESSTSMEDLFPSQCPQWHNKSTRKTCFGFSLCAHVFPTNPVAIRFVLNRVLSLTHHPREEEAPWVDMVGEWKPTHVVLNRGLHYAINEQFVEQLEETMEFLATTLPNALVMFRSTAPGHLNCNASHGPLRDYWSLLVPWDLHWSDVEGQNFLAKQIVEKRGGVYLDVEKMTRMRPDGHIGLRPRGHKDQLDCVHYCEPGPIDTWVRVWFNALARVHDEKWDKM